MDSSALMNRGCARYHCFCFASSLASVWCLNIIHSNCIWTFQWDTLGLEDLVVLWQFVTMIPLIATHYGFQNGDTLDRHKKLQ